MWQYKLLLVLVLCLVHTRPALAQWACVANSDCSDVQGSVCTNGACVCPTGQQIGSGARCIDLAPYHTSSCVEEHQCSRLFTMFECRRSNETDATGSCSCQAGYHYFHGRCWPVADFGSACTRDEQCITIPRNPYSLKCDGVCVCADGYYERQRGECRKIGYAVGDGCVIDEDCQFTNGVCEINSRLCQYNTTTTTTNRVSYDVSATAVNVSTSTLAAVNLSASPLAAVNLSASPLAAVRSHGVACNIMSPCEEPLECSTFGACVCPVGYYLSDNGLQCNAELGSQSTPAQCVGLLAEVVDGICTCPPNFFFEENMRDCIKVTRQISDSCVTDESCHTFGAAARCGSPGAWQLRTCTCVPELAVWDQPRQMCRLFAGIGEVCEVDSDCLAGEFEIQCVEGTCACPEGLVAFEGLCITTGLELGEACQATPECAAAHAECAAGECACADGYRALDGFCAAIIGGSCTGDEECVIEDTICVNETVSEQTSARGGRSPTCRCRAGLVPHDDVCWPVSPSYESHCNVTAQCTASLGAAAACAAGACACVSGHHHRDGSCWPVTDLFEPCTRTSQCFLQSMSDRTVCRNSICQCTFEHPYSEELHTCGDGGSSGSAVLGSMSLVFLALTYLSLS